MKLYTHIKEYERWFIEVYINKGYSIRWISRELNRSVSTISREIKRNSILLYNKVDAQLLSVKKEKNPKKIIY